MTIECLKDAMTQIDVNFGIRNMTTDERRTFAKTYALALKDVPDDVATRALVAAFQTCSSRGRFLSAWYAEIRKIQNAALPTANDLWNDAAVAARKIEANLYYQTHGGLMTTEGKLTGEDFKRRNAEIFAALPVAVQRWAGSPADLSEIFASRSTADLRQFVRPGFDRAVADAPAESLMPPPALPGGTAAQIGGGAT